MRKRTGVLIFLASLVPLCWLFFQNTASEESGAGRGMEPLPSKGDSQATPLVSSHANESSREDMATDSKNSRAEELLNGDISFLDVLSQFPPVGSSWKFRDTASEEGKEVQVSQSMIRFNLPAGDYTVECIRGGWKPVQSVLHLEPFETATIWVYRPLNLQVKVLGENGVPLSGAEVRWIPQRRSYGKNRIEKAENFIQAVRTNTNGLADLGEIQVGIGKLFVVADGYSLREIKVSREIKEILTVRLRKTKGTSATLDFKDSATKGSIPGVKLVADQGFFPGESDVSGHFPLPSWTEPGMFVDAVKTGYSRLAFQLPKALSGGKTIQVLMFPSQEVEIQVVDETNQPVPKATVLLDLEMDSFAGSMPTPQIETDGTGKAKVELPQGSKFLLRGLSEDGRSGETRVQVQPEMAPVDLVLREEKVLQIHLLPPSERTLHAVQCKVQWEFSHLVRSAGFSGDGDGNLLVPFPNLVNSIKIEAPGYLTAELAPNPSNSVDRGGVMTFRLGAAHRLKLHLQDENGIPISGMRIYTSLPFEKNGEISRKYPNLLGAEPTEHPGWVEKTKFSSLEAISDGQGNCIFPELSGDTYEFHPVFPRILGPYPDSVYGFPMLSVNVADAPQEVVWTLPRPKKVEVEALDGFTLEPVKRFTVRAENPFRGINPSWGSQSRNAEDSNFSGWVPAVEKYLTVSSPGYQEVRVDLDPSKPSESFSVRLFPGQVGNLVLQGQAKELAGQTITLFFQRLANPEDPAHPLFVRDHEVRVQVEDPNRVPFPLPGGEGYFLSLIAHYSKGFLWSFSPSRVPIQGTNDLVFVAKRRAYKGDPRLFK